MQELVDGAQLPNALQLAIGSMSLTALYDGEVLEVFPYLTIKSWGRNSASFWLTLCDAASEPLYFATGQGLAIADLLQLQTQEMAKIIRPQARGKTRALDWESAIYEVKVFTASTDDGGEQFEQCVLVLQGSTDNFVTALPPFQQEFSSAEKRFARASVEEFMVRCPKNIGRITGVRIAPYRGGTTQWWLGKITVQNMRTHNKTQWRPPNENGVWPACGSSGASALALQPDQQRQAFAGAGYRYEDLLDEPIVGRFEVERQCFITFAETAPEPSPRASTRRTLPVGALVEATEVKNVGRTASGKKILALRFLYIDGDTHRQAWVNTRDKKFDKQLLRKTRRWAHFHSGKFQPLPQNMNACG
jgi:hypothetical protein